MSAFSTNTRVNLKRLKDQVMVITGASSGIGLVTARKAARRGARVVLASRDENALRRLCDELRVAGAQASYVVADVGNEDDVRKISDNAIERFGGFDTWFNNAGVAVYGRLMDVSMDDQRRLFDTNFWGIVHGSRTAVKHLSATGGALINMGSVTSDRAIPLQGIYSASKHAIKAYTDALRMELEHDGAPVSVTLIKPASIDTPYWRHAKNYMMYKPKNPPPLYAPDVVADAVLFCAENPRRDVVIGSSGQLAAVAGINAPRITDQVMKQTLFDMQMSNDPADGEDVNNLHAPSGDLEERGGGVRVSESSLYTRTALNSHATDAFADSAGTMARILWRATRGSNKRRT